MSDCIFCKIVEGKIPSRLLHRDEHCLVFEDIDPQAPFHALVIPVRHIASLDHLEAGDMSLAGHLLATAARVAREKGVAGGYRLLTNCGAEAGQLVMHLHFHLMGGRPFGWPPG